MKTVAALLVFVSLAIVAIEGKIVFAFIFLNILLTQHNLLLHCFKIIISFIYFYHPPGKPGTGIQRCLCHGAGLNMVKPKLIEKIEIHPISPSCKNLEVV